MSESNTIPNLPATEAGSVAQAAMNQGRFNLLAEVSEPYLKSAIVKEHLRDAAQSLGRRYDVQALLQAGWEEWRPENANAKPLLPEQCGIKPLSPADYTILHRYQIAAEHSPRQTLEETLILNAQGQAVALQKKHEYGIPIGGEGQIRSLDIMLSQNGHCALSFELADRMRLHAGGRPHGDQFMVQGRITESHGKFATTEINHSHDAAAILNASGTKPEQIPLFPARPMSEPQRGK